MVWKPKEKEITPQEAIEIAKKELQPFWFGSEPLLAAIALGGNVSAHPLDENFRKQSTLMFFFDPCSADGEAALFFAREFQRRYQANGLKFLLVLRTGYPFFRQRQVIDAFLRKAQMNAPIVCDADGLLAKAFRAGQGPKLILMSEGKVVLEASGSTAPADAEPQIQTFLRLKDPGLPLLPFFRPSNPLAEEVARIDFGRDLGVRFAEPGFKVKSQPPANPKIPSPVLTEEEKEGVATFTGEDASDSAVGHLIFTGKWRQNEHRITTSDPTAQIRLKIPSPNLSLVVESLSKIMDPAKVVIEAAGNPVFETFRREELLVDDEGNTTMRVEWPRAYHCTVNLPERFREITLRFPTANIVPVALYGMRFSRSRD